MPGYKDATNGQSQGGKQQRCVWCNLPTTMACGLCSTGPHRLVPVCPSQTVGRKGDKKGVVTYHACLSKHSANQHFYPKGKQATGAKRARMADPPSPYAFDCEQ